MNDGKRDWKKRRNISVNRSITESNDLIAAKTQNNLNELGIFCVNILGSPGAGKTTLIEGIAKHIDPKEIIVIQGDLESDVDKKRLEKSNIKTHQINTHSGCHLNAKMINDMLDKLSKQNGLDKKKLLLIENVGNLVCPAGVKIGQHLDLVVSSTTEGSDKPKKYPQIFRDAEIVVISKLDLAKAVDFDEREYLNDIKGINSDVKIIKTTKIDDSSFKEVVESLF